MTAANHVTTHADGAPRTDPMDRTRFPIDPWRLVETACRSEDLGHTETLFAVANGYLGLRGNPEEGREAHVHGTFVNGVHETWRIKHAEEAYGYATVMSIGGALAVSALAALAVSVWMIVELGCRPGTTGPNRYGPDPL